MKSNTALITVLIGFLFILPGCSDKQAQNQVTAPSETKTVKQVSPEVFADLAKYSAAVNQTMKPWGTVDKLTDDLRKAKTAKAYTAKLRKEISPLVSEVLIQMESIKPATKEVQNIHTAFLASLKDYQAGLQIMAYGVEKKDDPAVNAAAVKLNALGPAHAKFIADVAALTSQNGVSSK